MTSGARAGTPASSAGLRLGHPHNHTHDSSPWLRLIAVCRMRKLRHRAAGRPLSAREQD